MGFVVKITCPICSLEFSQEAKFKTHVLNVHDVSNVEKFYVNSLLSGIHPVCLCGCGTTIKFTSWKKGFTSQYVRGHNATVDSVFNDKQKQVDFTEKRKKGFSENRFSVWNKGLTKQVDERLFCLALKTSKTLKKRYELGEIPDWRLDKEKLRIARQKISSSQRKKYASGTLPWNKGKTKTTDFRIARISEKIKLRCNSPDYKNGKKISLDELLERVQKFGDKFTILDIENYKTRRIHRLKFLCKECNTIQLKSLAMLEESPVCYFCHPKESKGQLELYDFVRSLDSSAILSDRSIIKPREIDIHVPNKICIEFNGLFWHSEKFFKSEYASQKTDACDAINVPLIQIFEDEWRDKQEIVKSIIASKLNKHKTIIGARKCVIRILGHNERKKFFEKNHIDGDVKAVISFGLLHDDRIVAAISLRNPFHKIHRKKIEVARFSVGMNTSIPGALSRLTKVAAGWAKQNRYDALMTYVDRRIGTGSGYVKSGWKFMYRTSQRFWWTDCLNRFDRFSIRADKKNGITQKTQAKNSGLVKIFGTHNIMLEITV